jgi:hypothetical protein
VQVTLGNQLIWTYGLHTVPVVEAIRAGVGVMLELPQCSFQPAHRLEQLARSTSGPMALPYPLPIHPNLVHLHDRPVRDCDCL